MSATSARAEATEASNWPSIKAPAEKGQVDEWGRALMVASDCVSAASGDEGDSGGVEIERLLFGRRAAIVRRC